MESPMINDVITRAFQNLETDALVPAFWKSPQCHSLSDPEGEMRPTGERIAQQMPAFSFELGMESPMINDVITRAFQNLETDALVPAFWKSPQCHS